MHRTPQEEPEKSIMLLRVAGGLPWLQFDLPAVLQGRFHALAHRLQAFLRSRLQHFALVARNKWFHPKLIGVAYEFQRVRRIKLQPWDVPLNVVVTELKVDRFR